MIEKEIELHAELSPSSAHRWLTCTGSVAQSRGIPNENSIYSEEGTHAHSLASHMLKGGEIDTFKFDERFDKFETISYVQAYVDEIRRISDGKILLVEQRVNIEKYTTEPGGKGTADAIIVDLENKTIEVHDLKYGKGQMVDADNNEQLMLYALGAVDMVEDMIGGPIETIKMVIHQPRRDHMPEYVATRERLETFGKYTAVQGKIARETKKGEGLRPNVDACFWCPAGRAAKCPAIESLVQVAAFDDFENLELKDPEDLGTVYTPEMLDLMEMFISAKRASLKQAVLNGAPLEGWKVVLGDKGDRKWKDETTAIQLAEHLKVKPYTEPKVLSVAQLEKLVPKKKWPLFKDCISQEDGKPTAVSSAHKRPVYNPAPIDTFDNISGGISDLL